MRKSIPTWRERLQGLDKPTDFAEAQAAKFEAADLRRYIAELEAASQPGEMGAGVQAGRPCGGLDWWEHALPNSELARPSAAASAQQDEREAVRNDPAVAAIQFALEADEGMVWLRLWNEGEFKSCREEWPEAPEECYIGADPLLEPRAAQQVQADAGAVESDKMWRWRYETLRALYPTAPSEEELDIAIRAAMSREQSQGRDREGGAS